MYRSDVKIAIFDHMKQDDLSTLREQLADSSRKLADITAAMVYENPELIRSLLNLTWLDEEPWSLRASRVVALCCCEFPELLNPFVTAVISSIKKMKSESARRNFLQIFKEADLKRIKIKSRDKLALLEYCFEFLDGNYSVGVKAYSMDIIYRMSLEFPDIQRELYAVLSSQIEESSAGYQSRALKIIQKLEKA